MHDYEVIVMLQSLLVSSWTLVVGAGWDQCPICHFLIEELERQSLSRETRIMRRLARKSHESQLDPRLYPVGLYYESKK